MAGRNFFRDMVVIRNALGMGAYETTNGKVFYSDYTKAVFNALVDFVVNCSFSTSKNTKFICENWDSSYEQMVKKWTEVSGKNKTSDAFRSQVSTASSFLYGIFSSFSKDAFLLEDTVVLDEVNRVISALSGTDLSLSDLFISEVADYCSEYDGVSQFPIEECLNELSALKSLKRTEIFSYLDKVDWEKLRYILSVLDNPLSSNRTRTVNHAKIDILRLLEESSPSVIAPSELGSMEEDRSVRLGKKYNIGITEEMESILLHRLAEPDKVGEVERSSSEEISRIQRFFDAYTIDSFRERISRVNKYDLAVALEKYKY